jgi:hypothetical protein
MAEHPFIITPSYWIGEGKISFSSSPDIMRFYTRWVIAEPLGNGAGKMLGTQDVEMHGGDDRIKNRFIFSHITSSSFQVELENELVGKVQGQGIIDPQKIAWEFRGYPNFEGFEVYELQENGDYLFHAEYVSSDQFRSMIDGRIWEKSEPLF